MEGEVRQGACGSAPTVIWRRLRAPSPHKYRVGTRALRGYVPRGERREARGHSRLAGEGSVDGWMAGRDEGGGRAWTLKSSGVVGSDPGGLVASWLASFTSEAGWDRPVDTLPRRVIAAPRTFHRRLEGFWCMACMR